MNVTLNESALRALLESERGPIGQEIRKRAETVVEVARQNVNVIMARSPINVSPDVDFEIRPDLSAVIGIRNTGSITQYLAAKEGREHVWLTPALAEAFPE